MLHLLLTMTLLATSIGSASARGAAPAVDHVVICSGHGVSVLYLDADGEPTDAPHLCPDCILHLVAPLLTAGSAMRAEGMARAVPQYFGRSQEVVPLPLTISARGPPVILF
ncbi:hypothetical protein [Tateyamaria sp. SN6-1]|uniref:hypothetical protein n=1 Tax=Tateyamaria sp. SN6-1 TaxID=3092148 RepID=UPI0039F44DFF